MKLYEKSIKKISLFHKTLLTIAYVKLYYSECAIMIRLNDDLKTASNGLNKSTIGYTRMTIN